MNSIVSLRNVVTLSALFFQTGPHHASTRCTVPCNVLMTVLTEFILDYAKWDTQYFTRFSNTVYTTAQHVIHSNCYKPSGHCDRLARAFITYYSGDRALAAGNLYNVYCEHTNDSVLFFAAYAAAEAGVLWMCDLLRPQLAARAPDAPALAYVLNRCDVAQGNYNGALERSHTVLSTHSDFMLMRLQMVDILVAQYRIKEACEQATNLFFNLQWHDPECAEVTGLLCSICKMYSLAAQAFGSVVNTSGTWKHNFLPQYIEALYRSGQRHKARTLLQRFRRSTLESFGDSNMYVSLVTTLGSDRQPSEERVLDYIDALLSDYVNTNRYRQIRGITNCFEGIR